MGGWLDRAHLRIQGTFGSGELGKNTLGNLAAGTIAKKGGSNPPLDLSSGLPSLYQPEDAVA